MSFQFPNKWISLVLVYTAGLFIQFLYLDQIFYAPNSTTFTTGGDGYFIYYNLLSHTCFGEGFELTGMNYPWGEYIFMTDSMASFTLVFRFLENLGFPICENAIGLIHSIIIALTPLTAVFIYLILKRFNVLELIAILSSLLICFLSPQISRLLSHFGLTFPFLIPACMWWFLRFVDCPRIDLRAIGILIMIFFFGLNNPYLGFICSAFLGLAFLFKLILDKEFKVFLKGAVVSVTPLLLVLLVIKLGDNVEDRVVQQWGFFNYAADIRGLFLGEGTLFNRWFEKVFNLPEVIWESRMSIGVVSTFLLLFFFVAGLFKQNSFLRSKEVKLLIPFCLSALFLYLFGAHFFVPVGAQQFIEEHMGFMTMFKAAARFLWPAYFVLSCIAVLGLDNLLTRLNEKSMVLAIAAGLILFSIWTAEVGQYLRHRFEGYRFPNTLQHGYEDLDNLIDSLDLSPDKYQAIYVLPKMQGWNDKLIVNEEYISSHFGMITAYRTQIPLINAKLSRMSIRQTILSQQFASPPYVKKELVPYLDQDKPILLFKSNKGDLDVGEKYLTEISKQIYNSDRYAIYSLSVADLDASRIIDTVQNDFNALEPLPNNIKSTGDYYRNGFEDLNKEQDDEAFYGQIKMLDRGRHIIDVIDIDTFNHNEKYHFSIWVHIDNRKHGLPVWKLEFLNDQGVVVRKTDVSSRETKVFYNNWARVDKEFNLTPDMVVLRINAATNQTFKIDELLIRQVKDSIYYQLPTHENFFMFNNYKIESSEIIMEQN